MGVDARMLVRGVPRKLVTEEWLREMSWRLCAAIGAKHFFISDGVPRAQYQDAYRRWHDAFESHPRHADFAAAISGSSMFNDPNYEAKRRAWTQARNAIVADIGEQPHERRLALDMTHGAENDDGECISAPGETYWEDAEQPIRAAPGECLLSVSLYGRYYGPGYERGDILTYCAVAEWLEVNLPGRIEIWYGGDSSGICASRFDDAARRALRMHLYGEDGREYFRRGFGGAQFRPQACGLCPGNRYHGTQFGTGRNGAYAAFHCEGCGKSVKTEDCGKTWSEHKDE